jgi:putative ABC transport system substrate-binding protein
MARIGFLSPIGPPDRNLASFRDGMRALGYMEGNSFVLEIRYAHRDYRRFQALVHELLATKVDVIVTSGAATRGAPFAAQLVPVVFGFSGDPVDAGIVVSFARPGGNATGVSLLSLDLASNAQPRLWRPRP